LRMLGHSDRPSFITDQRRFDHHGGTAERPADWNRFCVPVRPVDGGPRLYAVPPIPSTLRPDGVGVGLVTTVRDIRLLAYHAGQCDPKKCTSLRLRRFGLLTLVPRPTAIPTGALLLTPKVDRALSPADAVRAARRGLAIVDVSWKRDTSPADPPASGRALPSLPAVHPVHYAEPFVLS